MGNRFAYRELKLSLGQILRTKTSVNTASKLTFKPSARLLNGPFAQLSTVVGVRDVNTIRVGDQFIKPFISKFK